MDLERDQRRDTDVSFVGSYIRGWLRVAATVDVAAIEQAVKMLAEARDRDATVWTVGERRRERLGVPLGYRAYPQYLPIRRPALPSNMPRVRCSRAKRRDE